MAVVAQALQVRPFELPLGCTRDWLDVVDFHSQRAVAHLADRIGAQLHVPKFAPSPAAATGSACVYLAPSLALVILAIGGLG